MPAVCSLRSSATHLSFLVIICNCSEKLSHKHTKEKLEKEEKLSLDPYNQNPSAAENRDVNVDGAGAGAGDHHQYRHLLLHHLLTKPPTEQQLQYHFPSIPQQQIQQQESFIGSQQLLSFQQNQEPTHLNPLTRTQIQQQPIRKRALNSQGRGGAGKRAPGRVSGEIVEVEGGHIIRSTGRKDRHSKVCTAKGPRDRRVRLSANTAIQFYDVQDRLGYDRPSKAVDWLINKAKSAIDELPPWKPLAEADNGKKPDEEVAGDGVYVENNEESSNLLPGSMDSDPQFQSYQSQDLKLSLQSFQDPNQEQQQQQQSQFGFDNSNAWDETQQPDLSRFQRLIGWNLAGAGGYSGAGGSDGSGFMLIPQQQPMVFGQAANQFFTQRGTLQSNNTPLVRASINGENSVNYQDHLHHNQAVSVHPVSFSGIGFASSSGGFSGFRIPARIQGDHEEEQEDGNKPSSVASSSRH